MKKLLLLFCLCAASLQAEPATLDLGARGRLTLYFPDGWKVSVTDLAGQMTVTVASTSESVNADCTLLITAPDQDHFDTKARLKNQVEADGLPYVEKSVERKAIAREFTLTNGFGYYCSFTDPDLRGKPPEKGNYKVISVGKIRLSREILIDVSLEADGFSDRPYQELLGAIEGMEWTGGEGAARAKSRF